MEQFRDKIEQHAGTMEKLGLTPVSARVYIYLLFAPAQEGSFEELVDYFKVSKSAVSNALKYLNLTNLITARTRHGKRKRYFAIDLEKMLSVNMALSRLKLMEDMLTDISKLRKKKDAFANELKHVSGFLNMLAVEYPALLEKWNRMYARNARKAG